MRSAWLKQDRASSQSADLHGDQQVPNSTRALILWNLCVCAKMIEACSRLIAVLFRIRLVPLVCFTATKTSQPVHLIQTVDSFFAPLPLEPFNHFGSCHLD